MPREPKTAQSEGVPVPHFLPFGRFLRDLKAHKPWPTTLDAQSSFNRRTSAPPML